jgi:ferrous iron transport protein B
MSYTFALAGNQNSGKTTLFNQLTGSNQHVGNWPGVTVEQKTGTMVHHHHAKQTHIGLPSLGGRWRRFGRGGGREGFGPGRRHRGGREPAEETQTLPAEFTDVTIVDLPGIYSLSPYSMEEIVSRNYIVTEKPDVVINCVDATNLERNLYLTLQLLELGRPTVVALNMMDEVRSRGDTIDLKKMEQTLGVPVVAISARKREGLDELVRRAMELAEKKIYPARLDICDGAAHKALHAISHLIEPQAQEAGVQPRYAATKLFEGDEPMMEQLGLSPETRTSWMRFSPRWRRSWAWSAPAVMADTRYRFIEKMLAACVVRGGDEQGSVSDRIDNVLTHRVLAIPVFLLMMLLVFYITFGPIGSWLADGFSTLVADGIDWVAAALLRWGVAEWVRDLVVGGVLTGVGSVLSFLPTILMLFLLLSILEDSGYMARAAFLMDKPLRKIGLNGAPLFP